MNIDLVRLLLDFGLVVLIWIVQLVIYPSLCYYQDKDLAKWHKIYTQRIGVIVGPLMIAQLDSFMAIMVAVFYLHLG